MNISGHRGLPGHVTTLPRLFAWRVAQTPAAEAYRSFDHATGRWIGISWQAMERRVAAWKCALARLGLAPGARVAILLPNGLDAVCMDLVALALGHVPVPMHAQDNAASIAYVLEDSGAELLITATSAQWQAIAELKPLPALRHVLLNTAACGAQAMESRRVRFVSEWLSAQTDCATTTTTTPAPGDLAALVYTSGTTGKPKGVMLTHANVIANVDAVLSTVRPRPDDVFLSFLPLSHTFERTAGYYLPMAAGSCVAFARSAALLPADLRTVRPTVLVTVPRVFERVHARLQPLLEGQHLSARLFRSAISVGWRRFCRHQRLAAEDGRGALLDGLAWPLLQQLVARRMLAQFGGRLRMAVSGGAPLAAPIARTFLGLGLCVLQGYGMTETSPVVATNTPDDNDPATIGRALPGVEVRIGENHELQVRGPNVMRGYWRRQEDTQRAFLDGWLRTGDQAVLEGGRIRILGRIKEIIVTSTGEKVAPADLELAIAADPLFEQVYAFGDNRPFIACITVLGRQPWEHFAAELGLDASDPASLDSSVARKAALDRIATLTHTFPYYAQPHAVALSLEPWTAENGLLTPTLKVKRSRLAEMFASTIEALYRR